ncbi:MAG: NADPH:quinone oxidoreductase family protein [Alphaproteobacteria bacterium]|nr:NADPH:quinone oxidoreductase family protein [Alphaproteobacteria bacterium]
MKAVLCHEYGPPENLKVEDIPSPDMEPGHVRVETRAAGVNFQDTLIISGNYQFKPDMPFTPGSELAGVVTEVADDVKNIKVGDHVLVMRTHGGWTEEAVVPEDVVLRYPPEMDFVDAAAFLTNFGTSYHALRDRGELKAGETLLVLGASGGVGLAAVQIGKAFGARVIAAASSDEKLQLCKEHGADELVNYSDGEYKDKVKELTGGKGADVIYDAVGGDYFDQALRCINWKGRLLVVGFAAGRIPSAPANLILLKGCAVVGVFYGRFKQEEPEASDALIEEMIGLYKKGKLSSHVTTTMPLEKVADALNLFINRKAKGKIVLTTSKYEGK